MEELKNKKINNDDYLAKSNNETLIEHTNKLLDNYDNLKNLYEDEINVNWELLNLACIYHDMGKLNENFQSLIKEERSNKSQIPHGYLSVGFINSEKLEERFTESEIDLLITAVGKHHNRKHDIDADELAKEMKELAKIDDFYYDKIPTLFEDIDTYSFDLFYECKDELRNISSEEERIDYILLKGLLNKIDYAASGDYEIEYENDFLLDALNKYKESWSIDGKEGEFNDLQKYMLENQDKNIIAIAETGYGKTEAGLLWIGDNKGYFTLPLRSAINSIYDRITKEIVGENLDERVALLHSDTIDEYFNRHKDYEDEEIIEYGKRSKNMSMPLTISTLDQIFRFVYRYPQFEIDLANLSYGKVVIDEIQMYAPDLLAYLILGLEMITNVGGKFSIITATLPPFILDLLKEREIEYTLAEKKYFTKDRIRHKLELVEDNINGDFILEKYKDNKVLVIVNTVKKAKELYLEIKDKVEEDEVNIFHSGFIKKDRQIKEEEIIKFGNRKNKDTGIWICTQVAEASLDMDFDILITELSDLNGLFQRMGRCNRKGLNKIDSPNVFIFDGGEDRTSGVGFVNDLQIFEMSREYLRENIKNISCITEEDKFNAVDSIYTTENLNKTEYYEKIKSTMNYIGTLFDYEKDKNNAINNFRNIASIDIIPRPVYEENKESIDKAKEIIKDKNRDSTEKIKSRLLIDKFKVGIPYYLYSNNCKNKNNLFETIEINRFEKFIVYECEYSCKEGINHIEKSEEFDNII